MITRSLKRPQTVRIKVMLSLVLVMAMTVLIFATVTLRTFEGAATPELRQRTELLGTMLRDDLQRTLELGIPINSIAGLDGKVETLMTKFPEVQYVKVASTSGAILLEFTASESESRQSHWLGFRPWTDTLPILVGNKIAAKVTVYGNPRFLEAQTFRVLIDIGLIALAIVLLGTEVILALTARSIWLPREAFRRLLEEQRQGRFDAVMAVPPEGLLTRLAERLNDRAWHLTADKNNVRRLEVSLPVTARLPVFLLAFGTETTASFLPLMARSASYNETLPLAFAAAVPLILYLAAAAVMAPLAGRFVCSVGPRRAFAWAVLPVVFGLLVMSASASLTALSLGRMIVGVGYTIALVSCAVFALRAGGKQLANQTQSTQNTALFGGILAGTVVGGIAAFNAGYAAAILLGASVILTAFLISRWALSGPAGKTLPKEAATGEKAKFWVYAALVGCIAIPTSAITAVIIWYLMPLILAEEGYDAAMIARVIMLYYLPTIFVAPFAAQIVARGRFTERMTLVLGGMLVSGALLSVAFVAFMPVTIVTILGVGHALIRAPLYALVVKAAGSSSHWIDRYRMAERLGAIAAFVLAFLFFDAARPIPILIALGTLSLSTLIAFAMIGSEEDDMEELES